MVKTRRKNIGLDTEYTNNDPKYSNFFLDPSELLQDSVDVPDAIYAGEEMDTEDLEVLDETCIAALAESTKMEDKGSNDGDDIEPPQDHNIDYSEIYDQFEVEEEEEENYEFEKIVDHYFQDGVLVLKVCYQGEATDNIMDVPFPILKKDVPIEIAQYVRLYVIDEKRNGFYNEWATKVIKNHTRCVRRLHRTYNIGMTLRIN